MHSDAKSALEYVNSLPNERLIVINKLRQTIVNNLPNGFEETMGYGMLAYVVPFKRYPQGYHCDPKLPLPFINLASQKNFIALYHAGIYADKSLFDWFVKEYDKHCTTKLDMGKSCIRFKNISKIPYELIAELVKKLTVNQWISLYEKGISK